MPVPSVTYPTSGDNFVRSLQKWNQILFNRGGFSVSTPFDTLAPTHGDTIESSLQKINSILFQRGGFATGQMFATLAPTHGDTKETSARKINQIYYGGSGALSTPADQRANPVEVDLPTTTFNTANWYTIMPAASITLPARPGNSLLQVMARLKLTWTQGSNTNGLCDWSIDGGAHFWRTLHVVVNRTDDSSVNDAFLTFWAVVSGTNPSVTITGRQYTGGTLLSVIGLNDPIWPTLASNAVIFDMGPLS
jgi:hypothetical protein